MWIEVGELTTCKVDEDGEILELAFRDTQGNPMTLRVPFDKAQAVAMTLPQLLTLALREKTGSPKARYVFPLSGWRIEDTGGHNAVITTLVAEDGFEVSFCMPREACAGLGWALKEEARPAPDGDASPAGNLVQQGRLN